MTRFSVPNDGEEPQNRLEQIEVPRGLFITTKQMRAANKESIRLGFSSNLKLPDDLPDLRWPVVGATRHRSESGLENVRLMIYFTHQGFEGDLFLDVTPDVWSGLDRAILPEEIDGGRTSGAVEGDP